MHDTCTTGTPGRNSFRRCSRNFGAGVRTATIASIWPPRTSQRASSLVSPRPQAGSVSMKSKTSIGLQTVGFPVCKRRRQEACARKVHQRYQQLFTVRLSHRKKASRRHQDRTASGTPGSSHVRNWPIADAVGKEAFRSRRIAVSRISGHCATAQRGVESVATVRPIQRGGYKRQHLRRVSLH